MSEIKTYFVDILLPIPVHNLFTYRVPLEFNEEIQKGIRVVVPFGKKKLLTGLIVKIHNTAPADYQAKYLLHILDQLPIVTERQFRFWQWISDYYLAPIGDVMNAALPSNFKLASETKIDFHPSFEGFPSLDTTSLDESSKSILEIIENNPSLDLKSISEISGIVHIQPYINRLIAKKILITSEELKDRYSPKTMAYINFNTQHIQKEEDLNDCILSLEKSKQNHKQVQVLVEILKRKIDLGDFLVPIPKKELLEGSSESSIKTLIEKHILVQEYYQVDRIQGKKESKKISVLSAHQKKALEEIKTCLAQGTPCLFHGVTGSGKTEVYVELIQEYLDQGKQILYLLPEIALTTQLIQRLSSYFGEQVGVYHSRFNQNERIEVWNKVLDNDVENHRIILGARSSVFLPFQNLGLILVDEEHESSFKQYDPSPRYNGRDCAVVLSKIHKCPIVLGTATPSLESYYNAKSGKYGLVELSERYAGMRMPEILISDLKKEKRNKTMHGHIGSMLLELMEEELKQENQIILFQNRRGYNPQWSCEICNWTPKCENCDVSLTYHKFQNNLKCHYCSYVTAPHGSCPSCGSNRLKMLGFGTEKIEDELALMLKNNSIKRLDLDTTRNKNAYRDIIQDFESGEIQILVGTQMISKGLDFDNVSVVGILDADMLMNRPDFRAFERSFQMISQVAGRSGRKNKRGKVIIQTGNPDHWLLEYIIQHDYQGFYKQEIIEREKFAYPPFYKLIRLTLKHKEIELLDMGAHSLSSQLKRIFKERVLGPEYPLIKKIQNKYLKEILIKFERTIEEQQIKRLIKEQINTFYSSSTFKPIQISIDVDPI